MPRTVTALDWSGTLGALLGLVGCEVDLKVSTSEAGILASTTATLVGGLDTELPDAGTELLLRFAAPADRPFDLVLSERAFRVSAHDRLNGTLRITLDGGATYDLALVDER
jgi:hypothetical protein